jgi:hypothetical protein
VSPELLDRLADRLRWPAATGTVPGSLPVLFFGDLPRASIATIGINPSRQEYLSTDGNELDGAERRFETLASLGVSEREAIGPSHVDQAVRTMRAYFAPGKPVYHWFQPLTRVLDGFGASFAAGDVVHLDLVQEATDPVWSGLHAADRNAARAVLDRDLPFLKWEIEAFPLHTLVCTSAMVLRYVLPMFNARVVKQGTMARLRWTVAVGRAGDREVAVAGWNIPLKRPTGLDNQGQVALGALLRQELNAVLGM